MRFLYFLFLAFVQISISNAQEFAQFEVMDANKIRFDGKLARFFTVQEFEKTFGKTDSTALLMDIQPCNYIFEYEDGSKDADDEYWYKDGSRFERSKDRLAVDEFRFSSGHFILYDNVKLDASTTTADLAKLFPNATKAIDDIDVHGEGILQLIILREDDQNFSDGHICLFVKDGKLYFMHWWFPC